MMLTDYMDPVGPNHVAGLAAWLAGRNYAPSTVLDYARRAGTFLRWITETSRRLEDVGASDLVDYGKHLEEIGRWRRRGRSGCNDYTAACQLVTYLENAGVVTSHSAISTPAERLLAAFQEWSRTHRGIRDSTIRNYSTVVRDLIQTVGSEPGSYTARDLRAFVLERARRHGPATAEWVVTSTRVFLRYLVAVEACPVGFEHAIPSVAKWRLARLPRYVPTECIERVVRLTGDTSPIGARDRAVLLLLARLGLRAADIALLNLHDFDWHRARLRLAGKGRREAWLPLSQDVGDAVLHYLRTGRPAKETSRVFLLSRPPFGPIEPHVVSQIARRGLRRARVESPTRGARVFRHSLATTMLRVGVPLQTIASVLRHRCIDTTLHYTKVDIEMLKQVAPAWPEVSPC